MSPKDQVIQQTKDLIEQAKKSLNDAKSVALDQAWKILQIAIANIVQIIESQCSQLAGPDKKALAMDAISKFYDGVFLTIDIPFVPKLLQPIIVRYLKAFLMILVGSTIDAMVTTFRNTGVFQPNTVDPTKDAPTKISDK